MRDRPADLPGRIAHTSYALPGNFAPAEWWKHVASKRREAARAALAVEEDADG